MADRKPKALIIEDDQYSGEAYAHLLAAEGYDSEWAEDGHTGYRKAKEMRPDVVILDLILPGMDGIKVIELFRTDDALKKTPILVVTGRDEDARSAIDAGANSYLIKPVEFTDLIRAVSGLGSRGGTPAATDPD